MPPTSQAGAYAHGLRVVFSVPAAVLFATALGFGALARDAGFTLGHVAFLSVFTFALPNQVMLIDQLARGATLAAAALAVTLTAVRLLPMTITLMPLLKGTRRRLLLETLGVHLIAITTWIEGNRRLPSLPLDLRLPYHLGVGTAMGLSIQAGSVAGYTLVAGLPVIVSAALLFLTPLYFLLSLLATSRSRMDLAAIVLGVAMTPGLYLAAPGADLLVTGLVGGTLAFLWGRGAGSLRMPWRR